MNPARGPFIDRVAAVAFVCLLAGAVALLPPAERVAFAASSRYEHLWQAETVLGGERGRCVKAVSDADVTLRRVGGEFGGTITYRDLLGTQDPSGFHSQSGQIELALTGGDVEPGRSAGGTFEGTVILVTRTASSLKAAIDPAIDVRSDGVQAVYAVSGHWGARVSGNEAAGELIFERAELTGSSTQAAPLGPDYFNRLGPTSPGEPQTFTAVLSGVQAEPVPASGGGSGGGSGGTADEPAAVGSQVPFWRYVQRGLGGGAGTRVMPVAPEDARAARALRDAKPRGATPLPSSAVGVDIESSGAYLDALNRAAGLVAEKGLAAGFDPLATAWKAARGAAPGRLATPPDADPVAFAAKQLAETLRGQTAPGAEELAAQAQALAQGRGTATLPELRVWTFAAQAVAGPSHGGVVEATASAVRRVRDTRVPRSGPEWHAVLAAADSANAPRSAIDVTAFAREPSADASASSSAATVPGAVLARNAGSRRLSWTADGGRQSISPERWLAYRRADGRLFWLAGEDGPVALTDGTLAGWAFTIPRASLVSASRCGRVLARYPTG